MKQHWFHGVSNISFEMTPKVLDRAAIHKDTWLCVDLNTASNTPLFGQCCSVQ